MARELSTFVISLTPFKEDETFDAEKSMLSDDGTFDPESMKVLKESFVEMGILDQQPPDDKILTTKFLPVRP